MSTISARTWTAVQQLKDYAIDQNSVKKRGLPKTPNPQLIILYYTSVFLMI